jgi:uncharacterized protein (DUF362 family)
MSIFWKDALERLVATVVEAFCGSFITAVVLDAAGVISLGGMKTAALVGLSTALISALTFVKTIAAKYMTKDSESASFATLPATPAQVEVLEEEGVCDA